MTNELLAPPFTHPENITIGLGRVIYGPVVTDMSAWHIPGCRVTFDRDEAVWYAARINELLRGVQTVREAS